MSFNIVNLVKDQIQDQLLGQISGLLGDEGNKASGAIDSMIPGILSGLSGAANQPGGADSLFNAVQDQDDSLLDNLGSLLGGGQAASVIENGNGVLNSLLGGGGLGKLAGVLSAFSGISKGGTSSLMGILAPIIIGAIKRKVLGDGLNAGSLANLLGGQSSNIAAAMPQGFADQLSSSGLLSSFSNNVSGTASGAAGAVGAVGDTASGIGDGISNAASSVTGAVGDAAGDLKDGAANVAGSVSDAVGDAAGGLKDGAANVAGSVSDAAGGLKDGAANVAGSVSDTAGNVADSVGDGVKQGGSMFRWLLPLVVLAGLAWLAYKFLLGGGIDNTVDTAANVSDSATAVVSDSADATKEAVSSAASTATDTAANAVDKVADTASDAVSSTTDAAAGALDIDPSAIGEQVTGLFSGATDTLTGITDADSATAALPAIGELGSKVDSVSELFQKVPEAARGPIGEISQKGMGALEPIFNKTMELPGVGDIIGGTMGPIMEKLQELGS
jgi:phage-related protein